MDSESSVPLKQRKTSLESNFVPAFFIDPFATDAQNQSDNLKRYFSEFSRAALRGLYIIIFDLRRDTSGCVPSTIETLKNVAVSFSGYELISASTLLFSEREFPENFTQELLTSDAQSVHREMKIAFNTKANGFKSAVNNWVEFKFTELQRCEQSVSRVELKEYALLVSTLYVMLHRRGVPCVLHPGKIDSFLMCLENGPSFINKRMRFFSLEKFSALFCNGSAFENSFNQSVMVAYSRCKNPDEGFYCSMEREDGVSMTVNVPALKKFDPEAESCPRESDSPDSSLSCDEEGSGGASADEDATQPMEEDPVDDPIVPVTDESYLRFGARK